MKESHFRGLEESSYLGGDREKTLSFYFLFVWVKLPTKQNEKKIPQKMVRPPSSKGQLRIRALFQHPLKKLLLLLFSPCPDPFPSSALSRAEGKCPRRLAWEFQPGFCPFNLQTWSQALSIWPKRHSLGVTCIVAIKSPPAFDELRLAFSRNGALARSPFRRPRGDCSQDL